MGRPLSYDVEIDNDICTRVLTKREHHLPVANMSLAAYARKVIPTLGFKGSKGWVDRFLRRNNLVLRTKTSMAQRLPGDLEERIDIFHNHLRELRLEHDFDPGCIINMDETPLYFDMVPGKVVVEKGAKDVIVRTTEGEKRHVTAVLAVALNGEVLPPRLIFKGKRLDDRSYHAAMAKQSHQTLPLRRPALLVMDSFSAHTTDAVREECRKMSVTPAIIPGGCTSKVQPLDVSINKQFKGYMREEWMFYINHLDDGKQTKPTCRQLLVAWVAAAWAKIKIRTEMISKSFKVCGILTALDILLSEDVDEEFYGFGPNDIDIDVDLNDPFHS